MTSACSRGTVEPSASSGVTTSSASPFPDHGPSMSAFEFASGPTIAILRPDFGSGSKSPSFFSSAIDDRNGYVGSEGRVILIVHVEVDAGSDRLPRRFLFVFRDAVHDQLVDRVPVAHYEAAELPFAPQDFVEQMFVRRRRNPVQAVERGHDGCHALIDRGF